MQKIITRKKINFKLLVFLIIFLGILIYLAMEQFYRWQAKEKVKGINEATAKENFFKAKLILEEYSRNFKMNEEALLAKIKLLQEGKSAISKDYQNEIIQLVFFLKSSFAYEEKDLNLILGEAYYSKGEDYFLESKNYLEKFLKENNYFDLKLYSFLYEINLKLGFLEEAYFYLEKIVAEKSQKIEFKIALVELLLKQKKNLQAQTLLEEIILREGENPFLLKTIKLLFNVLNEFDLEKKMNFYHDYLLIKFQQKDDFLKDYQEYYQKLKSQKRKNI